MSSSQVVQVLRAIDRDEGGNDSTVYFNIPPESSVARNFSIRESGGVRCCSLRLTLTNFPLFPTASSTFSSHHLPVSSPYLYRT